MALPLKTNRKIISLIIVILLIAMVAGFNASFYILYTRSIDTLDQSLGDRLLSVGRAISPEVESVIAPDLPYGSLSLTSVVRLQDYLDQIRMADDLSGIYLLGKDNRDLLTLDDSTSESEFFIPLHAEALGRAALGTSTVSQLYRVDDRYFKSAYQPVGKDSVVAILLVESAFEFFSEFSDFRRQILIVNGVALAMLIVLGVAVFLLNRHLVRTEKLLISQAALSQMGQMAAVIAHEVRNPLAIIKASAERLKKKYGNDPANPDQMFDFIPEEVDRLNRITTHYLQFASPMDNTGKLESIGSLTASIVEGMKKEFEQRGVALNCDPLIYKQAALVDSAGTRQILVNLLRNALDASAEVDSKLREVELEIEIPNGHDVILAVSDTGTGLEKKLLKRIFDPFYTTKTQGTGLGLFIVSRLVDNLKGSIRVESTVGKGTKFTIKLPVKQYGKDLSC